MNDERFAPNNNPNRGNSRKEKKMNTITKTMSVAVLVALGLTLTTWAAEPLPRRMTAAKRFRCRPTSYR